MLSFEEQIKLGKTLIKWNVPIKDLKFVDLNEKGLNGAYIYEPIRGGKSVIVDNKGHFLICPSILSLEQCIEEFKSGKRTEVK